MRKRIIATLMALCMALSLLPVQVLATEGAAQKTESAKQKTESAEQTTGAASGGAKGDRKYHHTEWRQLQRHHFQREDSDREGDGHPRRTDAAHL